MNRVIFTFILLAGFVYPTFAQCIGNPMNQPVYCPDNPRNPQNLTPPPPLVPAPQQTGPRPGERWGSNQQEPQEPQEPRQQEPLSKPGQYCVIVNGERVCG
jgi:hypothetical protein